ncbi:rhodanese-like domain-containing protein [Brachyspira hyodysenteriae]|uniref:Rhodanese-like domain protein n=2 Tax=Brachyspira hyodysenteriae TaxID=159 RepID=A0A3B6VBU2_BRAHW|nr:rhodanese-like domain-containing protein [Brachyspira hyodysenteriae]ACN83503.1 rhodanese-like domain protein [Brachyspira hyodysenteriae WA1]ANN64364.1 sulfurtransferase [Brachyspira hyodysenteriae ATCC 27164]AUJ49240.1 sulfurtransferase [Brachyspira hyodysenteriae]KLI14252.1 sulfurtransferase [Brachyspira hyodysenteriae]KLI17058.1 sulfurtransferase [Brachyspira hyodysenteriae]
MKRNLFIIIALLLTTIVCNAQTAKTNEAVYELDNVKVVNKNGLALNDFISSWKADPNIILVDVRTPQEIKETGTIKGAMNIDYRAKGYSKKILSLDKTKKYFFYCKSGGRSGKTVQYLLDNGFKNVNYLKDAGYSELNAALKK